MSESNAPSMDLYLLTSPAGPGRCTIESGKGAKLSYTSVGAGILSRSLASGAVVLAAVLGVATPAVAELHYITRIEARKVQGSKPPDATETKMAEAFIRAVLPEGPSETTYLIGENTMRAELLKRMGTMPTGTILIRQLDGSVFAVSPAEHAYVKMRGPQPPPSSTPVVKPNFPITRTGETAVIAGVKTERLTAKVPRPVQGGPPGTLTVDLWVSNQFPKYAPLAAQNDALLTLLSASALTQQGFVMRAVVTGYGFADYQMESVVTEIKEQPAPPHAFELPAGYKEIVPTRPQ